MKKALPFLAFSFGLMPIGALAQEVVTDESGRKIVVQPDLTWRYFDQDTLPPNGKLNAYSPPKDAANEHQKRLQGLEKEVSELSLALVSARVELVEAQIAASAPAPGAEIRSKEQLDLTKKKVHKLEQSLAEVRERVAFLEKMTGLPPTVYERKLQRFEEEKPAKPHPKEISEIQPLPKAATRNTTFANGILLLPPNLPCEEGYHEVGPSGKKVRWETSTTPFFSHTDRTIESQFPKADFIECAGSVTAVAGGLRFLSLEFAVATINAPQIFGSMPQGEFIELELLDGQKIRLFNTLPDNGGWVAARNAYVTHGRYSLGFREEKLLRSKELDKVLVRWNKAQEQFQIYRIDFLMRQLHCLDALISEEQN